MEMNYRQPKTANGLQVVARQRVHQNREVETSETIIHAGDTGQLIVETSIGRERGLNISVSISLDEILAWLPRLVGRAKFAANLEGYLEAEAEQD